MKNKNLGMTYTNGVVLIDSKNNPESLALAVRKVTRYLEEERAIEAQFLLDDTVPYPCYSVPAGVTFQDIEQALRPNVLMRAINEDIIILPERKTIEIKYYYTEEEKEAMGKAIAAKVVEKAKVEAEMKNVVAEYRARINGFKLDIQELADDHQRGWEDRDILCEVKLNFADNTRYYIDVEDANNIVKGVPLETKDYQMRIDVVAEPVLDPSRETYLTGEPDLFNQADEEQEDDPNDGPGEEPEGDYAEGEDAEDETTVI